MLLRSERDVQRKGYTVVPLEMYLKDNYAKVLIGVAQGKRQYDKRRAIKQRDAKRRIRREMKEYGPPR